MTIVNFLENSFSLVYISMLRFKRGVRKSCIYIHYVSFVLIRTTRVIVAENQNLIPDKVAPQMGV